MAKKLKEGANVAWLPQDHPNASEGAGYYEITKDNEHELQGSTPVFTNVEIEYGKKLNWVKNTPDPEGSSDPENNEGHFEYGGSDE